MPEQDRNARRVQELGRGRRLDPDAIDARTVTGTVDAVAGAGADALEKPVS